jgi:hypothetical protein
MKKLLAATALTLAVGAGCGDDSPKQSPSSGSTTPFVGTQSQAPPASGERPGGPASTLLNQSKSPNVNNAPPASNGSG